MVKKKGILLLLIFILSGAAAVSGQVSFTADGPRQVVQGNKFSIRYILRNAEGDNFNEPTVEGDVFDGWIGDAYDYMPAHDLTYVANIITGIHSVYSGEEPMIVYDLNGRKVSRTEKLKSGIYIVNGKKTYIK